MNHFKITCSATLLLLFFATLSYGSIDKGIIEKEIKKSFPVEKSPTLDVINKFGSIDIHEGKSNEISVIVKISVDSKKEEIAQKILSEIEIDFSSTSNSVSIETEIGDINTSSGWFNWGGNNNINYTVNYTIYVPEDTYLDLDNAHGDINISTDVKAYEIELIFGDLKTKNIKNDIDLELAHGDASMGNFKNGMAEISFSTFTCADINDLDIESQHSKVTVNSANRIITDSSFDNYTINKVKVLENDGQHDNFRIGSIDNLSMDASFTDLDLDIIHQKATLDFEHGSIELKNIGETFTMGTISSEFSPVTISSEINLEMIIEGTFLDVKLPKNFISVKIEKDDFDTYIEGKLDVGASKTAKLSIEMENSRLKIR